MLQQTQVATVIPYFQRFTARFPDVNTLADAETDSVLALWTGLGYYARARNLHKAAVIVRDEHQSVFPNNRQSLQALPGIGRSTAAAILAQAHGQRHAILDGNVKRVLSRVHKVEGWPGQKAVENRLWTLSERHTPTERIGEYTQAIMDLGASLCARSKPRCGECPVAASCLAHKHGDPLSHPGKKPKKTRPEKQTIMLIVRNAKHELLLEQRPPSGIWGGLWSFPETQQTPASHIHGFRLRPMETLARIQHDFSHYRLHITPILCRLEGNEEKIAEQPEIRWVARDAIKAIGLPGPVLKLIQKLPN